MNKLMTASLFKQFQPKEFAAGSTTIKTYYKRSDLGETVALFIRNAQFKIGLTLHESDNLQIGLEECHKTKENFSPAYIVSEG